MVLHAYSEDVKLLRIRLLLDFLTNREKFVDAHILREITCWV